MVDHNNTPPSNPDQVPTQTNRSGRRGMGSSKVRLGSRGALAVVLAGLHQFRACNNGLEQINGPLEFIQGLHSVNRRAILTPHCLIGNVTEQVPADDWGGVTESGRWRRMAGRISMGARREVVSAVAERYRAAGRAEKGRILDELCATTGWHRKHAVRALRQRRDASAEARAARASAGASTTRLKDALTALWEASDRVCGKRLVVMIPTLAAGARAAWPTAARRERADAGAVGERGDHRPPARRREGRGERAAGAVASGFYSAIRREVPIRTFNDWNEPPPGFCEIDMVAHGGTSVAGSFIQTLTMVDVATGWTECLPLIARDGRLVVEAIKRAQSLFPWLLRGCRLRQRQRLHERRRRALVPRAEDRGDAVARLQEERPGVRRAEERCRRAPAGRLRPLRWRRDGTRDGAPLCGGTAVRELLPAVVQVEGEAARRREGDQALSCSGDALSSGRWRIRRWPRPSSSGCANSIARSIRWRFWPRSARLRTELGERIDRRAGKMRACQHVPAAPPQPSIIDTGRSAFAKTLGKSVEAGDPRATHRRPKRRYKKRVRMPSKLDPHVATIEGWLAAEPQLTALAIVGRLSERHPEQFGKKQHSIVQRLLKALRRKAAERLMAQRAALR